MAHRPARLDEYSQANPSKHNGRCRTCSLPPEILEQVDAHLLAKSTAKRVIVEWLNEMGYELTFPQVNYHDFAGHVKA